MVVLKTAIRPEVFGEFHKLLRQAGNPFEVMQQILGEESVRLVNFVEIMPGDRKFDGAHLEITLRMMEAVERSEEGQYNTIPIDRTMLDRVCDHLDIYPRSGKIPEEVEASLRQIDDVLCDFMVRTSGTDAQEIGNSLTGALNGCLKKLRKQLEGLL